MSERRKKREKLRDDDDDDDDDAIEGRKWVKDQFSHQDKRAASLQQWTALQLPFATTTATILVGRAWP